VALNTALANALDCPPAPALLQDRAQDYTLEAVTQRYLDLFTQEHPP